MKRTIGRRDCPRSAFARSQARAYRRPVLSPSEQLDEATKLTLARAMVGEADWHEPESRRDCFVLAKRWPLYRARHQDASFPAIHRAVLFSTAS